MKKPNNNITEDELVLLGSCQTEVDWTAAITAVKDNHGGSYPDDWWDKVKLSGLMDRVMARWGASSKLTIELHQYIEGQGWVEDTRDPTGQDEPDELELDEPNVQKG